MKRRHLLIAGAAAGLPGLGVDLRTLEQLAPRIGETDRVYRIHPGIGVARVGNCQSAAAGDYYLGPEAPGHHVDPEGGYKANGEIKRQGARFRIYEYVRDPDTGWREPVREITSDDAEITWTVTLANRKAYAPLFPLQRDREGQPRLRNAAIQDEGERQRLLVITAREVIHGSDPGPRSLDGSFMDPSQSREEHRVHLGDLLTDEQGRLILLGGYGRAFSPDERPLSSTFNNDGWCDETSDGTIRAQIVLRAPGETRDTQDAARVIVGPPNFAPAIESIVSLYDIAEDAAGQLPGDPLPDPPTVSFARHIFPLLKRTVEMRWVTRIGDAGHAPGRGGDFLDPQVLTLLRDPDSRPGSAALAQRQKVFSRLRKPPGFGRNTTRQNMPRLNSSLTLTPRQYRLMQRWADGEFDPDLEVGLDASAPSFEQISDIREQLLAVDRAGLDACVGGSFHPGIEASAVMHDPANHIEPFRDRDDIPQGTLTEAMSLPWQTDFQACGQAWWPAQRPMEVLRRNRETGVYERVNWANLGEPFVTGWPKLEFLVPRGGLYVRE